MSSVFNFIFNTMRARVNNMNNQRFWLPNVLLGMEGNNDRGKLLPLKVAAWKVGAITGNAGATIAGSFKTNYASYLERRMRVSLAGRQVIANPDTPNPVMTFDQVTINGLQNLWIMPNPPIVSDETGYHVTVTLKTNYYDGEGGKPSLDMFGLSGQYLLAQSLCVAANEQPTVCTGDYGMDINGRGAFKLLINGAFIQASLRISIQETDGVRRPVVIMTGLKFMDIYNNSTPGFSIGSLSIVSDVSEFLKNVWIDMSIRALTSPEGQAGIFEQINHSLNEPGNLNSISQTLTPQLIRALDKMIGEVPAGQFPDNSGQQLPNPTDVYMFDRLRFALNNPDGQWYLPRTVRSLSQPVLEPLHIDKIQLPDQQIERINYRKIQLANITMAGLSNLRALARDLIFDANGSLDATLHIGGPNPPPLTCKGYFSIWPDGMNAPLTGGISLTIQAATLHFQSKFSGDSVEQLELTLRSAVINADPAQLQLNLQIDSAFKNFINSMLNTPNILQTIIKKLNEALSSNLSSISKEISQVTARGIASRLDS